MKNIIHTFYREPKVDRDRILRGLRAPWFQSAPIYWVKLVSVLIAITLFLVFVSSLIRLNITFMPTALSMYSAVGGVMFFVWNIVIGMCVFIAENYIVLLPVSSLIIFLQLRLISMGSGLRARPQVQSS